MNLISQNFISLLQLVTINILPAVKETVSSLYRPKGLMGESKAKNLPGLMPLKSLTTQELLIIIKLIS